MAQLTGNLDPSVTRQHLGKLSYITVHDGGTDISFDFSPYTLRLPKDEWDSLCERIRHFRGWDSPKETDTKRKLDALCHAVQVLSVLAIPALDTAKWPALLQMQEDLLQAWDEE